MEEGDHGQHRNCQMLTETSLELAKGRHMGAETRKELPL